MSERQILGQIGPFTVKAMTEREQRIYGEDAILIEQDIDSLKFYPKWESDVLSECWVTDKEGAVIDHQKVER